MHMMACEFGADGFDAYGPIEVENLQHQVVRMLSFCGVVLMDGVCMFL